MNLFLDTPPNVYTVSDDPAFSKFVLDNPDVDWPKSLPSEREHLNERVREYLKVGIGPLFIYPDTELD